MSKNSKLMSENLKEEIAREQVKIFLSKMEKLGFDRKEMISMIENMEKEEE